MRRIIMLSLFCLFQLSLTSQNTIGVRTFEPDALEGLTFFSNFSGTNAYMIDNCGRLVNRWERGTRPGLAAYFLEDGNMFRTYKPDPVGPFTSASNAGGIELVDWDNNTLWRYELNTDTEISHHDAEMLPNGNVLLLTWELRFTDELIAWGRDPNEIAPQGFMWSEKIIEVEPDGPTGGNVVWQWEIKDHYIQEFDSTKLNFGVVAEHPELYDINLADINSSNSNASRDWNHFNAIDYNAELDQILISVRNSDEIWIIDHSTTIEEAAGHTGGKYGKGGDILYRWGNANAYDRGTVADQKLFGQHGVHWIEAGNPNAGDILIFNNGNGRPGTDFSRAEILRPPQDSLGFYTQSSIQPFGPPLSDDIYGNTSDEFFYSAFLSNAQQLENGNMLINAGSIGIIFEINPENDIVWDYLVPLNGNTPLNQGQNLNSGGTCFRAYKYPLDYPGFEGVDLTPGEVIENDNDPEPCLLSNTEDIAPLSFEILQADGEIQLNFEDIFSGEVHLISVDGIRINTLSGNRSNVLTMDVRQVSTGIYYLSIVTSAGVSSRAVFIGD